MDQTRSWPLPLTDNDLLDLKADALPLTLLPVEPGQSPRLVADGPDAQRVVVATDRAGDELRVHPLQTTTRRRACGASAGNWLA